MYKLSFIHKLSFELWEEFCYSLHVVIVKAVL